MLLAALKTLEQLVGITTMHKKYLFPILELQQVSKNYGRGNSTFSAVNKISLQIQPHEVMGLVGESGSGKSTLAKMILMLEKPSEGTIFFNNQNLF